MESEQKGAGYERRRKEAATRFRLGLDRKQVSMEQLYEDTDTTASQWKAWLRPSGRFLSVPLLMEICYRYDLSSTWLMFAEGPMFMSTVRERGNLSEKLDTIIDRLDRS